MQSVILSRATLLTMLKFSRIEYLNQLRLEIFPQSGRIVPELQLEMMREIIFGNYRIVYRLRKEEVEVLIVFHAARLFDFSKIL